MGVCNIFNKLNSNSGNFMMFSQYVEDITRNFTESDNWKVIPTKFVAMDIDYSKVDKKMVLNNGNDEYDLNIGIPKYFQNCFENACAYARNKKDDTEFWKKFGLDNWNPDVSRNLFWNYMFDGNLLTTEKYGSSSSNIKYVPQIMYFGDINMHSYNEHKGMGYGEIYCYIPTSAERMQCQVMCITDSEGATRKYDPSNKSTLLEGHKDRFIENYPQRYFYNRDFSMSFDDNELSNLVNSNENKYNINTIVVLYSVFRKFNNEWEVVHSNIPMGMYITGRFDQDSKLTNSITKYVSTNYDTGTSYGLRICTRFTATTNGTISSNTEIITDNSGYTNVCQLMTAMNENLSKMLDVSKSAINTTQQYKDLLSIIKTNRTNVPYVKNVNGIDCWFVNGRFVSAVNCDNSGINQLAPSTVKQRLDNLSDNDATNDYTYIEDSNGPNYEQVDPAELADKLGLYDIMGDMNL